MWDRQAGCRYGGQARKIGGGFGPVIEVVVRSAVKPCGCGWGAAFLRRSTAMLAIHSQYGTDRDL